MWKVLLVILVLGIIGLAWWTNSKMNTPVEKTTAQNESSNIQQMILATYQGMLPCADCSGMDTKLVLYQDSSSKNPTTYLMTSVYTGKNVSPLVENGSWSIMGGQGANRSEVIYKLTNGQSVQSFLKKSNSLELLDSGLTPLPSDIPSKLFLK